MAASCALLMQMRYLGSFGSEVEAARAFDEEAITLRGVGVQLNLPHEAAAFRARLREEEAAAAANGGPLSPATRRACVRRPDHHWDLWGGGRGGGGVWWGAFSCPMSGIAESTAECNFLLFMPIYR